MLSNYKVIVKWEFREEFFKQSIDKPIKTDSIFTMLREAIDSYFKDNIYSELISGEAQKDREIAHERALDRMETLSENNPPLLALMRLYFKFSHPSLKTNEFGINFPNPVGIAAGLDKNGRVYRTLLSFGFGHVEVGSVTKEKYSGNPRTPDPRVYAFPKLDALWNSMGFPGDGLGECLNRFAKKKLYKEQGIVGINVGVSRPSFLQDTVIRDLIDALDAVNYCAHYRVINGSSPNTPGVRGLLEKEALQELLSESDKLRYRETVQLKKLSKPILLKISPDCSFNQIDQILEVASNHQIDGIIATNTTTNPEIRSQLLGIPIERVGGVSGAPLRKKSSAVCKYIFEHTQGKLPIIRVGGVLNSQDAWNAFCDGASLVQVLTGFVNQRTSTPSFAYYMNKGLVESLKYHGIANISAIKGTKIPYKSFS